MIINWKQLDYDAIKKCPLEKRHKGNQGSRTKRRYKDIICAFDIETSRVSEDESIMYIWQAQIGDSTVVGRSWKECGRFFRRLASCCGKDEAIVIFVHNLSFEFAYLAGLYHFSPAEVFAVSSRKVLKCDMYGCLEFRCSYLHSNMSLDEYTHKMGVLHAKLSGFDYDVVRYPWTKLTDEELAYCVHDVQGLCEAIKIEMAHDGDNLHSFPLTSTGYVRRDVKKSMKYVSYGFIKKQLPSWPVYVLLRQAFRGGNTHCNRYFAGEILRDVHSVDISSSYPSAECNNRFPVAEFKAINSPDTDKLMKYMLDEERPVLAQISLYNARLSDHLWGCPYLATDKCRNILHAEYDNGRILRAEYLETTVTDIDLRIILDEYDADHIDCITLYVSRYGWLPDPLIDCIQGYYRAKTELKGDDANAIYYNKAKAKLNSIYGLSAQCPVKRSILYKRGAADSFVEDVSVSDADLLEAANRKAFFPYQWGIWCTAWARLRLHEGIKWVSDHGGDFVYCDTDSVKYMGSVDWTEYNAERILDAEHSLAYADDKSGKRHYMGVYEQDDEYTRFASRGAKKYAYEALDGSFHITVAGVNKKAGAQEMLEAGGLEAFLLPSFTFRRDEHEAVYNDTVHRLMHADGHRLKVYPCVTIRPSFKTLSDPDDYTELIKNAKAFREFRKKLDLGQKSACIPV